MKKSLVKKVLSIVTVSLVCALVLVTIILALVPKRLENVVASGYSSITIYSGEQDQTYHYRSETTSADDIKSNEIFNKIGELHKDSLKDSLLSAMFQGVGSFDISVVGHSYTDALAQAKTDSQKVVVFTYLEEQTLKIHGKEYKYTTALSGDFVTFDMIVMPVGNTDNFEERTIYLAKSDKKSQYQVKYLAHHSELSAYIDELNFPAQ